MKKIMGTLILILFTSLLQAPPSNSGVVFASEGVNPFEGLWKATCKVESNFNPFAIGDNGDSYGISQIQISRLDDFYRRTGIRYTLQDMFDVNKSREVFMNYCFSPYDFETISRSWNGGSRGMQKKSTKKYWKLVQKHLN